MQLAPHIMNKPDQQGIPPDTNRPLRVVIAYDDVAAGKRAMTVLSDLGQRLGDDIQFQPLPWSFDLLTHLDWREVASSDAVNAEILIIATSAGNSLPPEIGRWAETTIDRKRGTASAVVALFGSEENPTDDGSFRIEAIRMAARHAGLAFFAPASGNRQDDTFFRIHQRADMVTPLLENILCHRPGSR
jgi:hypothetical protein